MIRYVSKAFIAPGAPLRRKIALVAAGLFSCVVFLEIGIRLSGLIILSLQEHKNRIAVQKKGVCRIMCLGESTTFSGAQDSYPAQLEAILNKRSQRERFSVINGGVVGVDTDYILSHLEDNLDKYKPDIVTAMMGLNDKGVKYYEGILDSKSWIFSNSRIYRFLSILWAQFLNKSKGRLVSSADNNYGKRRHEVGVMETEGERISKRCLESAWRHMAENELVLAEEMFRKAIGANPASYQAYVDSGWCYRSQGRFDEAEKAYRKASEIEPSGERAYLELGGIYVDQGRPEAALEVFNKATEVNPLGYKAYASMALIYARTARHELAKEYFLRADKIRSEYYNPVTRRNYLRLKEILDKRKIKLACIQYPMRSIEPLKKIFSSRGGILFVDNEKSFKGVLRGGRYEDYFTDMFAGDSGHCTKMGNRIIAENIANTILK